MKIIIYIYIHIHTYIIQYNIIPLYLCINSHSPPSLFSFRGELFPDALGRDERGHWGAKTGWISPENWTFDVEKMWKTWFKPMKCQSFGDFAMKFVHKKKPPWFDVETLGFDQQRCWDFGAIKSQKPTASVIPPMHHGPNIWSSTANAPSAEQHRSERCSSLTMSNKLEKYGTSSHLMHRCHKTFRCKKWHTKAGWCFGPFFYFSIYWKCHNPNWRSHSMIFQRGRSTMVNHQPEIPMGFRCSSRSWTSFMDVWCYWQPWRFFGRSPVGPDFFWAHKGPCDVNWLPQFQPIFLFIRCYKYHKW